MKRNLPGDICKTGRLGGADEKRQRTGAVQDAGAPAMTPEFHEMFWNVVARRSRDTAFVRTESF